MKRVTGVGGVFFRAKDPKALYEWYRVHLGIESSPDVGAMFGSEGRSSRARPRCTIWSIFSQDTVTSARASSAFMINFRVDNLDELVKALREEGVEIDPKVENHEYGKFAWIKDPEGNRIELWEPPKGSG